MKKLSVFLMLLLLLNGFSTAGYAQKLPDQKLPSGVSDLRLLASSNAIAVGTWHACAIVSTGEVYCWGSNEFGQLGDGTWSNESLRPVKVDGLTNVIKITASSYNTCALTAGGAVKCWGADWAGQLGDGSTGWSSRSPVSVVGLSSGVTDITNGREHTCAVVSGALKCWGLNNNGQLGDGTTTNSSTPVNVSGLSSNVVSVGGGWDHTCAVVSGGTIRCWGRNWGGQLGDGTTTDSLTPVSVVGLSGVTALAVGEAHTCATTGAGVKCWGSNLQGQLGDGTFDNRSTPVSVGSLTEPVAAIALGSDFSCALISTGGVKCWGKNSEGQLGDGTRVDTLSAVPVSGLSSGVQGVAAKGQNACAVVTGGAIRCWGMNDFGQIGNRIEARLTKPGAKVAFGGTVTEVSAGLNHSCLVGGDEKIYCWGYNNYGQLGDNTTVDRFTPVLAQSPGPALTYMRHVAAGAEFTCGLTMNGEVWCWGNGWRGELGDGLYTASRVPVKVAALGSGVLHISAGLYHACAVTMAGAVLCWGMNSSGQLGNGTTDWSGAPVQVSGLTTGSTSLASGAIASGLDHSCAVLSTGGVKCWGQNSSGQLGDGTTTTSTVPVSVSGITDAVAVTVGLTHSCALTSAGAVKCWGSNTDGELGNGSPVDQSALPVQVTGLTSGITQISAGAYHTCAVLSGQTIKCWGYNATGQLGDGTNIDARLPVNVAGITGALQAESGGGHTCAVLSDGSAKCWGTNGYGQLGLGNVPWVVSPAYVIFQSSYIPLIAR